ASCQVVVKDGNGCPSAAQAVTVGQPPVVSFTFSATAATCFAGTDGTITVTPSGGSGAGYQYSSDNGVTFQAANLFNGLAAATYQVVVKDGNGCPSAAQAVTVGQPPVVSFSFSATAATCFAGTDGTITVTPSGGSGAGYQYSSDNGVTFQAANLFNGLAAATYQVVVKDGNGCPSTAQAVTVGQPPVVSFTFSATPATCFAGTDGTITVTPSGGSGAGYQYSSDNGVTFQAANLFNGLAAATYQVVVKDGNGCPSAAQAVTVGQPTVVSFTFSATPATCFAGTDGTITVTPSGGSGAGYQYSSDNGVTF